MRFDNLQSYQITRTPQNNQNITPHLPPVAAAHLHWPTHVASRATRFIPHPTNFPFRQCAPNQMERLWKMAQWSNFVWSFHWHLSTSTVQLYISKTWLDTVTHPHYNIFFEITGSLKLCLLPCNTRTTCLSGFREKGYGNDSGRHRTEKLVSQCWWFMFVVWSSSHVIFPVEIRDPFHKAFLGYKQNTDLK